MRWWNYFGVGLQLLGAFLALWGIDASMMQLFPSTHGLIPARQVRWLIGKVRRPKPHTLEVAAIMHGHSLLGAAVAHAAPPADAPVERWIAYLAQRVEQLDERITNESAEARHATADVVKRVEALAGELSATADRAKRDTAEAVGGLDARGFRLAAGGIYLAILGTALASF